MAIDVQFHEQALQALIGGANTLDTSHLNISDVAEAKAFIKAYGFDVDNESDLRDLWRYHRRAVTFIRTELMEEGEEFPDSVSDPNKLKDLCYLLIYASTSDKRAQSLQNWSCAVLRVVHVLVHLDNDLFNRYSREIQDQILKPYQKNIYDDPTRGVFIGDPSGPNKVALKKYAVKPFKTSNSSVTKLLAKPNEVAFSLLDKMGVRFVTKNLFDVFAVLRFLVQNSIVSLPHVIPDQSNNTLYPLNLFLEVCESVTKEQELTVAELDAMLNKKLESDGERGEYLKKTNKFTSQNYRFLKFITRALIRIPDGEGGTAFSFFYPYEVQIVDYDTYLENLSGSANHNEYKQRQKSKARKRVLGYDFPSVTKASDRSPDDSSST